MIISLEKATHKHFDILCDHHECKRNPEYISRGQFIIGTTILHIKADIKLDLKELNYCLDCAKKIIGDLKIALNPNLKVLL